MDPAEFVKAIKLYACDLSVDGTAKNLLRPSGRRPHPDLLKLSAWFKQLPADDQITVLDVAREAAENAIFGVFCILDGVRAIENGTGKGGFEIHYVKGDEKVLLNATNGEMLHDIFQGLRSK